MAAGSLEVISKRNHTGQTIPRRFKSESTGSLFPRQDLPRSASSSIWASLTSVFCFLPCSSWADAWG